MKENYTKGPWRWEHDAAKDVFLIKGAGVGCNVGEVFDEDDADLIVTAPKLRETIQAIKARINGEWDNPALVKMGPLMSDAKEDIMRFVEAALAR